MPTLLNRMSTPPNRSTVASTTRLQSDESDTSASSKSPSPPRRSTSATVASPASRFTSAMATFAPSLANSQAVACPMPSAPPVMMTTFPSKLAMLPS